MSIDFVNIENRLPYNWFPKTPAQMAALNCSAEFLLFGGAAGSLKSTTMLVAAAQQIDNPRYRAIIFRKSFPEIEFLMDRSIELYTNMGATLDDFNKSKKIWNWPSGAKLEFKFIARDKDIFKYQGPEYQFIGFDESTQFSEAHVRYLVNSRGRSTDPTMKEQVFMATNPGNIGHSWHKRAFIGPRCVHCLKAPVKGTRIPGKIYENATWLDGVPINLSTCFIPGRVTDHNLFGEGAERYAKKLKGLTKSMMKALLEGCWEAFEGMYFDLWNPEKHVIEPEVLSRLYRPFWGSWVSTDYGFAHAMVSYLFHRSPTGRVYVADEFMTHRVKAKDHAMALRAMWWDRYKPQCWYLSPDAFSEDGSDDFSAAQQMCDATGFVAERAYDDRVAGWTTCYALMDDVCTSDGLPLNATPEQIHDLQEPKMMISEKCPMLISSIPTRIHDDGAEDSGRQKHRLEDVKKTPDDEDDAADAWRYGVASHVSVKQKTREEEINERQLSHDPTTAMIQRMLIEKELAQGSKQIPYTGRARTSTRFNVN